MFQRSSPQTFIDFVELLLLLGTSVMELEAVTCVPELVPVLGTFFVLKSAREWHAFQRPHWSKAQCPPLNLQSLLVQLCPSLVRPSLQYDDVRLFMLFSMSGCS